MKGKAKEQKNMTKDEINLEKSDPETLTGFISYESALSNIPYDLYNHLAWMMTKTSEGAGKDGRVSLAKRQHQQVMNIAQDIMASVTDIKMPKHVGLALHILKQTRSKDLVTIMNRFGHYQL